MVSVDDVELQYATHFLLLGSLLPSVSGPVPFHLISTYNGNQLGPLSFSETATT